MHINGVALFAKYQELKKTPGDKNEDAAQAYSSKHRDSRKIHSETWYLPSIELANEQ